MRLIDITSEAWRNVRAGTIRPFVAMGVTTCVALALALLEMTQVGELVRQAEEYRAAGASTYRVLADDGVDGRRCQALDGVDGVEWAGALRATDDPFAATAMPRSSIPVFEATPGLAAQLGTDVAGGVILDADTASQLGVRAGDSLAGTGVSLPIGGIYQYPDDGRDQRLSYAIVRTGQPAGRYDECWVQMWPPDLDTASWLLRSVVTADADPTQVQVGQLNSRLGQSLDARARFDARTGRFAWPVALLATALAMLAAARLRRLEISFARHLGLKRIEVATMLVIESLFPAGMLLSVVTAASAITAAVVGQWVVLPFGLRVACAAALGCLLGGFLAGVSASERRVQAYFKAR